MKNRTDVNKGLKYDNVCSKYKYKHVYLYIENKKEEVL